MYLDRSKYRSQFKGELELRQISVLETDLAIGLDPGAWTGALEKGVEAYIRELRQGLDDFISLNPEFKLTHDPYLIDPSAPPMALKMAKAGNLAGVGPLAAVAGAFAQEVGEYLAPYSGEVFVENGGDLYLAGQKERIVGIFAGKSTFSGKIGLKIKPAQMPLGICTSSGTVGPSFSYGNADAVTILSRDAYLADAVATATANCVQTVEDVERAAVFASAIAGISGVLAIKDKVMGAWGGIELVSIA